VDAAVLTVPASAPPERTWDVEAAARALEPLPIPLRVIPVLAQAVQRATTLAPHGTVVVTGSFHTVGEAMEELRIEN
jgi:folylpolyglutamate synthase/dihydropteroate synthase